MSLLVDRPHRAEAARLAHDHAPRGGVAPLALGALGVVFGSVGTSPLYAMDQIVRVAPGDALGAVSLAIWSLTLIVAVQYPLLVLRAQNDGEGGVFALYGLLHDRADRRARLLLWALMAGAGLLIGDGMITPAISVLSAVEGLGVAVPGSSGAVVPITLGLLVALFAIQFKGASGVGSVFGPVVLVWFVAIAALGGGRDRGRARRSSPPSIRPAASRFSGPCAFRRGAPDPRRRDAGRRRRRGDVCRRRPFRRAADPALLVRNRLSGAPPQLSRARRLSFSGDPVADGKLFFALAPHWLLMPMVALATAATVIASQALISGAFSLVSQAIRLGLFPRLEIRHTHHAHEGQIYIPLVNWMLLAGCAALVWSFGSSVVARGGLRPRGVRRDGDHFGRDDPGGAAPVGLEPRDDGARLGAADGAERRLSAGELAETVRGRLRADRRRFDRLRRHGDLALGPQGDLSPPTTPRRR